MPRTKYKKKPESWYCIQYDGTNFVEIVEWCPLCRYDSEQQKLFFTEMIIVDPTSWILEDNAGIFTVMNDSQFNAFFQLAAVE